VGRSRQHLDEPDLARFGLEDHVRERPADVGADAHARSRHPATLLHDGSRFQPSVAAYLAALRHRAPPHSDAKPTSRGASQSPRRFRQAARHDATASTGVPAATGTCQAAGRAGRYRPREPMTETATPPPYQKLVYEKARALGKKYK